MLLLACIKGFYKNTSKVLPITILVLPSVLPLLVPNRSSTIKPDCYLMKVPNKLESLPLTSLSSLPETNTQAYLYLYKLRRKKFYNTGPVLLFQDIVAVSNVAVTVVDAVVSMHQRFLQKY
jgi:hypothetical protein